MKKISFSLTLLLMVVFSASSNAITISVCNHSGETVYVAEMLIDGDVMRHLEPYQEVKPTLSTSSSCQAIKLKTDSSPAFLMARNAAGDHIWGVGNTAGCMYGDITKQESSWSIINNDPNDVNCGAESGLQKIELQSFDLMAGEVNWSLARQIGDSPLELTLLLDKKMLETQGLKQQADEVQNAIDLAVK